MSDVPYYYNRFVDRYTTQTVAGDKRFTGANVGIGSGTGFILDTGAGLGWSDDGLNTFTFAAGSSGLTASTYMEKTA
jgi:hypothetical protein